MSEMKKRQSSYDAIDRVLREDYKHVIQIARALLKLAQQESRPERVFGRFFAIYSPTRQEGPPSSEELLAASEFQEFYARVERRVVGLLEELHSLNPTPQRAGRVLARWLETKFTAKGEPGYNPAERVVALGAFINLCLRFGFIPYRQLPMGYRCEVAAGRSDPAYRKVEPLVMMVRRVALMEQNHDWIANAAWLVINELSLEAEKVLFLKFFVRAMQEVGRTVAATRPPVAEDQEEGPSTPDKKPSDIGGYL